MSAAVLVDLARGWLILGAAVSVVFLAVGIDRIDKSARGAYAFRPLLVPGILLIWPLVIWRWVQIETGREQTADRFRPPNTHGIAAVGLAAALAAAICAGLWARQTWPVDVGPQLLSVAVP